MQFGSQSGQASKLMQRLSWYELLGVQLDQQIFYKLAGTALPHVVSWQADKTQQKIGNIVLLSETTMKIV